MLGGLTPMFTRSCGLIATLFVTACTTPPPAGPISIADLPNLDTNAIRKDIQQLSSDEYEGRKPGTKGEQLAVQYLTEEMRRAGIEPGTPGGTWTQKVPLVGMTPKPQGPLIVKKGSTSKSFKIRDEVVAFSKHVADEARLTDAEMVFVGYGVQAPEYQWDDFKGLDVKGKTIVVLVNDPPIATANDPNTLESKMFGGKAMTYYGRWPYKYEKAAELGAAGVF